MPIEIVLPTLHPGQVEIWQRRNRYNAVRCGRRWGKTILLVVLAANAATRGKKVGVFTPEYRQLNEPYEHLLSILHPVTRRANKTEGTIRTTTGGLVDFWTLTDNELAGRGREYDLVLVDEGAFTKNGQMIGIWKRSIRPTMLTRPKSETWVFSTPNGVDPDNFFWWVCNDPDPGFVSHHAPTASNPFVPASEIEEEKRKNHPLIFRQEILAEFVDLSGEAFFSAESLMVDGQPVDYPAGCDQVFAVIDTAVKQGQSHDGTAVSYWAESRWGAHPLTCLDWDVISIDGALLESWIPSVFSRLEDLAKECRARFGSSGAYIEDAQSGAILLQQCQVRGLPVTPLPAALTAAGKDARAINASGPVYRGDVKISRYAHEKTETFKGATRNHFLAQVTGFRVGDKDAARRSDDLLDTFTYAVSISLGNSEGFA